MAALAGLAAAVTWAAASTLIAIALRRNSPPAVSAGRLVVLGLVQLTGLPVLLLGERPEPLAMAAVSLSALLGGGVGDTLYTAGLRHLGQATTLPLSSGLYPLATFLLGALIFDEALTLVSAVGASLVVGGALLVVYSRLQVLDVAAAGEASRRGRGLALVLAGTSLWVLSALAMRWGIEDMNPVAAIALRAPVSLTLALPMFYLAGPDYRREPGRIFAGACLAAGLLAGITSYLFLTGVRFGGVGRTTILFSTAPLIGLVFSRRVLSEGVGLPSVLGTLASVIGVVLIL